MTDSNQFPGDFQAGDIVDDTYIVVDYLGRGAMGHVYRVRHKILKTEYALKTLSGDEVDELAWKRFQIEAQAIAMLNHPNVVGIYNFGLHEQVMPYYAMDFLQGIDLSTKINKDGPLEPGEAVRIFIEVCAGLSYAHGKGMIHRDIKPGNIFLLDKPGAKGQTVKVVDFGMVKLTQSQSKEKQSITSAGIAVGTPTYMSPEQCAGAQVDARSDIYSLGCTLFESVTGTVPFRGRNATETMLLHKETPPPSLSKASGGKKFPFILEYIIAKTLSKLASERYQSTEQLGEALSGLIQAERSAAEPIQKVTFDMDPAQREQIVPSEVDAEEPEQMTTCDIEEAELKVPGDSAKTTAKKRPIPTVVLVVAYFLVIGVFVGWQSIQLSEIQKQQVSQAHLQKLPEARSPEKKAAVVHDGLKPEQQPTDKDNKLPVNQITSASLMIERPFSTITSEAGINFRIFKFPTDVVIGLISSSSGGPPVKAVGQLRFPADELITFTPAEVVQRYPKCLKRFKSGDIYCVKFEKDTDSDEILEAASNIPDVQMLDFDHCLDLTPACVTTLNKFKNLTVFCCPNSAFDGAVLPKAKCWDKLEVMVLADFKKIAPMLKSIQDFKHLKRLVINTTELRGADFKVLAGLSQLEVLNLDGTNVTKSDLGILSSMPNLRELDIQDTGIDASASDILKNFKSLKTLGIKSSKLNPGQLEKLRAALPGVTIS